MPHLWPVRDRVTCLSVKGGNPESDQTLTASQWITANAQIVHPSRGRIAFEPYPYQQQFFDSTSPRRLINKARQVGFSQAFGLEALYYAINEPESTILMVSKGQDAAINLLRYCYLSYNALRNPPRLTKENESEIGFANGSRIKSLPANRSTGRTFAANRVYLDEFAYAAYADDIYQSVSPTLSHGGYLTIASSPNGMGNKFHSLCISDEGFERMTVQWFRCPAYNPIGYHLSDDREAQVMGETGEWYQRERPKYTSQQWAAEFECDFVGSGASVFPPQVIDRAEVGAVGEQGPRPGRLYLTSMDVGRRADASVLNTFDVTEKPFQRVAHERFERVNYPTQQALVERRMRAYGGRLVIESNGVGDPFIENLTVYAEPFTTTARTKQQAIETLLLLLENGELKAQWTAQERKELMHYQWADSKLQQDCVMSLAIGMAAAENKPVLFREYEIDL